MIIRLVVNDPCHQGAGSVLRTALSPNDKISVLLATSAAGRFWFETKYPEEAAKLAPTPPRLAIAATAVE